MAVTTYWFAKGFLSAFNEEVDYAADTMKVALSTSSFTPNQDTHDYYDDITNELSTANGYTATGATLGSKTIGNTANVVTLDSADPTWTATGAGFTARILTMYDSTPGSGSTNPLMLWSDFGQDETASGGGAFTYQVNASGWATITVGDAP